MWIPLSQTSSQRADAIKHLDALESSAVTSSKNWVVTGKGKNYDSRIISFAKMFESSDGYNGGVRSWGGSEVFEQELRKRYKVHNKLEWSGNTFEHKFVHYIHYLVGDGSHIITYFSSREYEMDFLFFIAKETWKTYGSISLENLNKSPVNLEQAKARTIKRDNVEQNFSRFQKRFNSGTSKSKKYASKTENRSAERRRERAQQQKASSAAMHKAIMGSLNSINTPSYQPAPKSQAPAYNRAPSTTPRQHSSSTNSTNTSNSAPASAPEPTPVQTPTVTATPEKAPVEKKQKDYSDSARGTSEYCYKESQAIDLARTAASNRLKEKCSDNGWYSARDITYGQTADCTACSNNQSRCSIIAKGWCYK